MSDWNIDFEMFSKAFLKVIESYVYYLYNISNNLARDREIRQRKFSSVKLELKEYLTSHSEYIEVKWITYIIDGRVKKISIENFEDEVKLQTFTEKTNALIVKLLNEDKVWYDNMYVDMKFVIFNDKIVHTVKRLLGVKKLRNEDWTKFFEGDYNLLNRGSVTHLSYKQKAADVWSKLDNFYYKKVTLKRINEMVYNGNRDGLKQVCHICMDVDLSDMNIEICKMNCGKYNIFIFAWKYNYFY